MGILIFIILFIVLWPFIKPWFQRFMARRMEDAVRKMAGMPTRKQEEKMRRQQQKQAQETTRESSFFGRRRRPSRPRRSNGEEVAAMRAYAVDVEYTEIKEYSESTIVNDSSACRGRVRVEEQISDVEFTEIKD